jgi:1,4-dihydroxy-2-naphthoate octaprenyltransferase
VTPFGWALSAGLGLFALAVLESANIRAISPEERDGRLTLVRLLGQRHSRIFYACCLAGAYGVVVVAAALDGAPHGALAVLFSLPVAVVPLTGVLRAHNAETLAPAVRGMHRAYAAFAFWLIIGLLLGGLYLHLLSLLGA